MLKTTRARMSLVVALAAAGSTAALAAPAVIRLSTMAPAGTTWDTALRQMGADWSKATAGRVTLRVTGGGAQGSEKTVLRNMRPEVNTVDASLLTSGGLAELDEGFNVFGIPFFFASDEEEVFVRGKLEPVLAKRLEAKQIHLLAWGHGGWVQVFSTVPLKTLADVKKVKLYTGSGSPEMVSWYTSNGFNPVPLEVTAIPQALATGIIQATPMPPYGAVATQISRTVKYMLDVDVDPLIGALIMTDAAWNKIAPDDREKIIAGARTMERTLQVQVPKQDADSVKAMQAQGLTVTTLDAAGLAAFHAEAERLVASMRGQMVPADVFDLAMQARTEYRQAHGK
jgi:TRAP-type C4-dicarboxylate transport system substrate-binding protein